ncbi:TonB-dependent Receptor Plug Domain [Lutibacter oricola]|uniref:TonB-dependent Receptor Plug Domain n=1 Tax=Lutibacter oricola TaxID=762486 RepID=A0A1H2YY92_9FLAO|nr:TonB-dependent receptor plug domain-containing protein [Lutibacter oricola]SDX10096.1 TonB-dependent Receptor Plug Domain [Lutibacter oricola]
MYLKKILKIALFFTFLILFQVTSNAQDKVIKGKVLAFKIYPLKNVTVETKKTKNRTVTDSLGNFSIKCSKKDAIKVKAYGFNNYSFKAKGIDSINANLIYIEGKNSYKDVIKYDYMTKEQLNYCLENLIEDNNNYDIYQSVYEVIELIYPGVNIYESPDDGRTIIELASRGPKSIFAKPDALLVIDGMVVQDISSVIPANIKTIKVLTGNKAGHWGMRGGNGAIEITLKYE